MCRLQHLHKVFTFTKMEKKQVFKSEEVDSLVFFDTDNSTTPSVTEENFELPAPISQKLLQNLKQTEVAKGFTATQPNSGKLILEKNS